MNNKGFIFIETIITTVILLTTLVLLYSTFSGLVTSERARLYEDDIAFVYQTKHINDLLYLTIDRSKFNENYALLKNNPDNPASEKYLYFFNYESDIFYNNRALIVNAYQAYNWKILAYVDFDSINDLKECVKGNDNTQKCLNTMSDIKAYSTFGGDKAYLIDYLTRIDVRPDDEIKEKSDGILISLFFQAKNGSVLSDNLNYDACLNGADGLTEGMKCEKAPYIAWVYSTFTESLLYGNVNRTITYGDVNKDGNINMRDVIITAQYVDGRYVDKFDILAADVNMDGYITQQDVTILSQYTAHYPITLPCTDPSCYD